MLNDVSCVLTKFEAWVLVHATLPCHLPNPRVAAADGTRLHLSHEGEAPATYHPLLARERNGARTNHTHLCTTLCADWREWPKLS